MNLVEYQKAVTQFAVFGQDIAALEYVVFGLSGEAAEVSEKLADFFTLGLDRGWDDFVAGMIDEVGDACWYAAALANLLGVSLDRLSYEHPVKVYSFVASVPYVVAFAGKPANSYKKVLRGDKKLNDAKIEIILALAKLMWAVRQVGSDLDVSFESILERNINKLTTRKQNGNIMGDGDNR